MAFVLNKPGFLAIIASLTGLSPAATTWMTDPEPAIGDTDRARVRLTLLSISALGVDEHRRVLSPPGYPAGSFVTTEIGNRELKIQILAEALDYGVDAAEIVDLIRTGIRSDAVTAQLDAIKLAYETSERTSRVPTIVDTRWVSVASADFSFGGIASLVSSVTGPAGSTVPIFGDYIATVDGNNIVPGTVT